MPLKELKKHPLDYVVLVIGVALCLLAYTLSWPNYYEQRLWAVVLGVFYTFWGLWHHDRTNSLHAATVLEYVGLGFLATSVLFFALNY